MIKKSILIISALTFSLYADAAEGEKVFKTYCWGCHHQTSEAFGPSFSDIASKRTIDEIKAYIIAPEGMYEAFGYKRTAMSKLDLTEKERDDVAKYILEQKGK
ncbi:MAG: cytochrome c [Sulfurimonas sp.]|jgi:mono/diheme cytochrome c family protein|nr:cytochrome c [Sulfurimonadaceae bacterium]